MPRAVDPLGGLEPPQRGTAQRCERHQHPKLRLDRHGRRQAQQLGRAQHLPRELGPRDTQAVLEPLHQVGSLPGGNRTRGSEGAEQLGRGDEQRGAGLVLAGAAVEHLERVFACTSASLQEHAPLGPLAVAEQALEWAQLGEEGRTPICLLGRRCGQSTAMTVCSVGHLPVNWSPRGHRGYLRAGTNGHIDNEIARLKVPICCMRLTGGSPSLPTSAGLGNGRAQVLATAKQ